MAATFTGLPLSVTGVALAKHVLMSGAMLVNPQTNWNVATLVANLYAGVIAATVLGITIDSEAAGVLATAAVQQGIVAGGGVAAGLTPGVLAAVEELRRPTFTLLPGATPAPVWTVRSAADAIALLAYPISNATNATPIQITTSVPHGLVTGTATAKTAATISGVTGNTAANGTWQATVIDATNFTISTFAGVAVAGNGGYGSGGVVVPPGQSTFSAGDGSRVQIAYAPALITAFNGDMTILSSFLAALSLPQPNL